MRQVCELGGLTRRRAYVSASSARPMASRRLNPRPTTPFSGRGMTVVERSFTAKVFRKASFSAKKHNNKCNKQQKNEYSHTFQFLQLCFMVFLFTGGNGYVFLVQ